MDPTNVGCWLPYRYMHCRIICVVREVPVLPLSSGPRSFFSPPWICTSLTPLPLFFLLYLHPLPSSWFVFFLLFILFLANPLSLFLNFLFTMAAPAHTFKVADIVCIPLDDESGQLLTAAIHSPWPLSVAGRLSSPRLRCPVSWPSVPSTVLTSLLPVPVSPVVFT